MTNAVSCVTSFLNFFTCHPDISLESSENVPISFSIGSITFVDDLQYFKDGPRYIKGKVTFSEIYIFVMKLFAVLNNMHYFYHSN